MPSIGYFMDKNLFIISISCHPTTLKSDHFIGYLSVSQDPDNPAEDCLVDFETKVCR